MPGIKKDLQPKVLEELRRHGNVSRAARACGINRRTISKWANNDNVFKAAFDAAKSEGKK